MITTLQFLIPFLSHCFIPVLVTKDKRTEIHPTYVAVAQIDFDSKDKFATLLCKTFTDDLDAALQKQFGKKENIHEQSGGKELSAEIEQYITGHLQIDINGQRVKSSFINYKEDEENNSVGLYFRINNIDNINNIKITDTIFYELYDNQIQIIYVIVNGNRKSSKIRNPASQVAFDF